MDLPPLSNTNTKGEELFSSKKTSQNSCKSSSSFYPRPLQQLIYIKNNIKNKNSSTSPAFSGISSKQQDGLQYFTSINSSKPPSSTQLTVETKSYLLPEKLQKISHNKLNTGKSHNFFQQLPLLALLFILQIINNPLSKRKRRKKQKCGRTTVQYQPLMYKEGSELSLK